MDNFFNDTMAGLLQAIQIAKGETLIESVPDMPGKTYRASQAAEKNPSPVLYSESKEYALC